MTLGGATAVVALVVLAASAILTTRELRSAVDQDLLERYEQVERSPLPALLAALADGPRRRGPVNLDAAFRVIRPNGSVAASSEMDEVPISDRALAVAGDGGPVAFESVTIEGRSHRLLTGSLRGPRAQQAGAVQLAIDTQRIENSIGALTRRAAAIGGMLIAAAAAIGWLLAGRTIGPLEALTAEAERIAATEELTTSISTDRTDEVGRLAAAFTSMLASLRASREQQQRLVADAGHEFRTPLTALRTNLETLDRRGDELDPETTARLVDAALAESIELSELAAELVDLSQDVSATGETTVTTDLHSVAAAVVDRFRTRTDTEIRLTGVGTPVSVRTGQTERAIGNLVSNAVTWNDPRLPITVEVDGSTLTVRDHGPGIPPEDLPRVFDRFHRATEARTNPGSGLGLAIVRHVVEGHGGTVFARNARDGGAEVGFTLPPVG